MRKHTPGPWTCDGEGGVTTPDGCYLKLASRLSSIIGANGIQPETVEPKNEQAGAA